MATILRRPQFVADVRQIWRYISRDNMPGADMFVERLERRYKLLAERPQLGVKRLPNHPTLRIFPF